MNISALYSLYQKHPLISTDTRNIPQNSLFFALKGANFDGNSFADQALAAGASYVIIDNPAYHKGAQYICVADVLTCLQNLAQYHRQQLRIPLIGITGTNGKTTTKELLYAVLSQKFKTFATKGNLNNHIGVPLSLLAIDEHVEIAIIEMGANHIGEIEQLSRIALPTHGLISNVGKAHLEGFGSFEGVKKAKGELYDFLAQQEGTLFLQADNPYLVEMAATRNFTAIQRYGFSEQNDIIGHLVQASPLLEIAWKQKNQGIEYRVKTNLTGSYNTENFLAAIAVGDYFGLSAAAINQGIADYIPTNNRSQITQTARNTVICDYYNANASSMQAALDNIQIIHAGYKVAILGDMFELGAESAVEHKRIVYLASKTGVDRLIFIGQAFYQQKNEAAEFYKNTTDFIQLIEQDKLQGATILLKGSRGMAFEKILPYL